VGVTDPSQPTALICCEISVAPVHPEGGLKGVTAVCGPKFIKFGKKVRGGGLCGLKFSNKCKHSVGEKELARSRPFVGQSSPNFDGSYMLSKSLSVYV